MPAPTHLAEALRAGLTQLDIVLDAGQHEKLLSYLLLLDKWNHAYNLSGIKDIGQMVAYHLLDSVAMVPFITGNTILDVGTGAGLPGIPLAICLPDKKFLLLDANGKKTRFLFQVKTELGLDNVSVFHQRVENFQSPEQIDIVLCRAFSALDKFVGQSAPLVSGTGKLLAMKGQFPAEELAALPANCTVTGTTELAVPGVEGTRHVIEIRPTDGHLKQD